MAKGRFAQAEWAKVETDKPVLFYANLGYPSGKEPTWYQVVSYTPSKKSARVVMLADEPTDKSPEFSMPIGILKKGDEVLTCDLETHRITDGRIKVDAHHYAYDWDGKPKRNTLYKGTRNCKDATRQYEERRREYSSRVYIGIDEKNRELVEFHNKKDRRAWVAQDRANRIYCRSDEQAMEAYARFKGTIPEPKPEPKTEVRAVKSYIPNVEFYVLDKPKKQEPKPAPGPEPEKPTRDPLTDPVIDVCQFLRKHGCSVDMVPFSGVDILGFDKQGTPVLCKVQENVGKPKKPALKDFKDAVACLRKGDGMMKPRTGSIICTVISKNTKDDGMTFGVSERTVD